MPASDKPDFFINPAAFRPSKEVSSLPKVILRDGESKYAFYSRFRKTVTRSGVMSSVRRKRWFVSKNELRRIQKKKAIRRAQNRQRQYKARMRGKRS